MKPKSTIAWTYLDVYGCPCVRCFYDLADAKEHFKSVISLSEPVQVLITVIPKKKGKK